MSIKVIPGELNLQATSEDLNLNVGKEFNVNAGENITIKTNIGYEVKIQGEDIIILATGGTINLLGNVRIGGDLSVTGSHPFAEAGHGH